MNIVTIPTRHGTFAIDRERDEKMAAGLEKSEYLNEGLLRVARQFVHEGSVVLDIGAHIGTFAIPVAALAEKVVAFEPSPEAAALLSRNVLENKTTVQVITKALGSEKGRGTLLTRNGSNAGANTLVAGGDIPVTTLDDEAEHADFIKMDVEGMELEVLRGGTRLIERSRPVVLFEVNLSQLRAHGASPRSLERFFTSRGYRLYVPLEQEDGMLARVRSATLFTALVAPRAWLFFGDSAPFDLVAVPEESVLASTGFLPAIRQVVGRNLIIKGRRLRAFFRRILQS